MPSPRSMVVALILAAGLTLAACSSTAPQSSPAGSPAHDPGSTIGVRTSGSPDPTADAAMPTCTRPDLKPAISGGGPAMGYVAVVLRFTNTGPACQLGGWPHVEAISGRERDHVDRRILTTPALVHDRISGPTTLTLRTGDPAYLIIDGSDQPPHHACPAPYRRFLVQLPGLPVAFQLPARVPNGWDYFPACVPLRVSPLEAKADVISNLR